MGDEDNADELEKQVRKLVWKILWKWLSAIGVAIAILALLWTEIVRPSIEQRFLKEAQQAKDETVQVSREAQEILSRIKHDSEAASQASQHFEKKFKALSGQFYSMKSNFQKEIATVQDRMLLTHEVGVISHRTSKQIDTHKFDFPVNNAWIELPFAQCVEVIRIKSIGNQEVTVEIEYPAQDRCHRTCYYKVWATSLASTGSIDQSIRKLQNLKPR